MFKDIEDTIGPVDGSGPTATPPRSASRRTTGPRRRRRVSRSQIAATVLGLLVVCSLLAGTLGAAVFDLLGQTGGEESQSTLDEATELEQSLRDRIVANPNDAASMAELANLLANGGEVTEAILWYEKALAAQPANTTIRLDFARSLAEGGKQRDAEVQFRRVLTDEPNNVEAHYYLGELYRSWQPPRADEAVSEYRRVVELRPDSYLAQRATEALIELGAATPGAVGTPA